MADKTYIGIVDKVNSHDSLCVLVRDDDDRYVTLQPSKYSQAKTGGRWQWGYGGGGPQSLAHSILSTVTDEDAALKHVTQFTNDYVRGWSKDEIGISWRLTDDEIRGWLAQH